jgi:hypothetical protein
VIGKFERIDMECSMSHVMAGLLSECSTARPEMKDENLCHVRCLDRNQSRAFPQ